MAVQNDENQPFFRVVFIVIGEEWNRENSRKIPDHAVAKSVPFCNNKGIYMSIMKKIMAFAGFFIILLAVYGAGHLAVYRWFMRSFSIESLKVQGVIAAALLLLGGSFFLSSLLAHYFNSALTRFFYYASGLWMGILVNLLLGIALYWAILFGAKLLGSDISGRNVAVFCIASALLLSAYGTYAAKHFAVKKIQVSLPGIPDYWRGKKIVQLSDVHLGFVYREDFIARIKREIETLRPDMIVITGDLFDGSDGDLGWVGDGLRDLQAPEGVYFVTGNHETYLGVDKALKSIVATHIEVLDDARVEKQGLQIIGISYPLRGQAKDIESAIMHTGFDKAKPSILLYHSPTQIQQAKSAGVSLQLSGHTHLGQLFPFNYVTKMVFKGYDYGLKSEDGFSIYTSNGLGTWGPAMRTDGSPEVVEITLR